MKETKNILENILTEIEGVENNISTLGKNVDDVMEILLGRKSEYTVAKEAEMKKETSTNDAEQTAMGENIITEQLPVVETTLSGEYVSAILPELQLKIHQLNESQVWNVNFKQPLKSSVPVLGSIITLIKWLARLFIRPIVRPIIEKQTEFNAAAVQTINQLLECLEENNQELIRIHNSWQMQTQNINSTLNILNDIKNNQVIQINEKITSLNTLENELRFNLERTKNEISEKYNEFLAEVDNKRDERINNLIESKLEEDNIYSILEYDKFEHQFRGTQEEIRKRQLEYLPYLENKKKVIDLGCGRGEFLELLRENGIPATGVDTYKKFVNECKLKNLDVFEVDALTYVDQLGESSVDGIVSFQLIEHLKPSKLVELCKLSLNKLISGGTLIFETPNPTCLSVYTNSFYMDMTHEKPIHPLTLKYILKEVGFSKVEIKYTEASKVPYRLPLLEIDNVPRLAEYNDAINGMSDLIWGSQDYAVIATK